MAAENWTHKLGTMNLLAELSPGARGEDGTLYKTPTIIDNEEPGGIGPTKPEFEQFLKETPYQNRNTLLTQNFPDQSIQQPGESEAYRDKTTYKKPKTEGEKLEEKGDYIDTGEGPDSAGNLLMIEGNPSFDINPNKKTPTESEARKNQKLQDRVDSQQQGSKTAKDILKKRGIDPTGLPNFFRGMNPQDLLKILYLIPALGGFNLQMADRTNNKKLKITA